MRPPTAKDNRQPNGAQCLAAEVCAPFVGLIYLTKGKQSSCLACDGEGKHEVKAYLYTHDQGGRTELRCRGVRGVPAECGSKLSKASG